MDETTTNNAPVAGSEGQGGSGKWAWVITGIVVIAALAFYAWPEKNGEEATTKSPADETAQEQLDSYTASLENVSSSDEVVDIEKDLTETNLSDLDQELSGVESELQAR